MYVRTYDCGTYSYMCPTLHVARVLLQGNSGLTGHINLVSWVMGDGRVDRQTFDDFEWPQILKCFLNFVY